MADKEICLLNDSFPPIIDGVANAVTNYARVLHDNGQKVCVVTPEVSGADDSGYPYPVLRYQSLDLRDQIGYTVGNPLSLAISQTLKNRPIGLLHSHCPMMSQYLARTIRVQQNVPIVMTYHTKFDIDIANAVKSRVLQKSAITALVENVSASDELWVVSRGAGENIRSLGYQGDYIVMENGVDMQKGRASEELIEKNCGQYDLPSTVPVFLFVGRLMWYKGLRIILDAMKALSSQQVDYRMVFIGSGGDEEEIKAYTKELMIDNKVFFVGAVRDRDDLRAWYSRADMFLFPSTFDTNGLVVREASACELGSVLIRGSAAAEGIKDNVNGVLIDENAASLTACLMKLIYQKDAMRTIGENACDEIYLSWDSAVKRAMERYEIVMDNYKCGKYPKHVTPADSLFKFRQDAVELLDKFKNMVLPEGDY